jgi:hypothetical protein
MLTLDPAGVALSSGRAGKKLAFGLLIERF